MIRENTDLSFPSPPPVSLDKRMQCFTEALVLHVCVSCALCLAVLGLIFGHLSCRWEGTGEEGEMRKMRKMPIGFWAQVFSTRKLQGVKEMSFISLSISLCLCSMLQPVQFIMQCQLSVVIRVSFLIHPQSKANPLQICAKDTAINCICFCCPACLCYP